MKLIAIGGEPATGKSTLIKKIIAGLESSIEYRCGLFRGTYYVKSQVILLGIYDEKTFSGTDRLSMGVMKDLDLFLNQLKSNYQGVTVLFEGDRLFNGRFLETFINVVGPCQVLGLVISASAKEKEDRHVSRNDTQTETFKKGRATKYKNLLDKYNWLKRIENNTYADQDHILKEVLNFVKT
jgi:hypothetical protein